MNDLSLRSNILLNCKNTDIVGIYEDCLKPFNYGAIGILGDYLKDINDPRSLFIDTLLTSLEYKSYQPKWSEGLRYGVVNFLYQERRFHRLGRMLLCSLAIGALQRNAVRNINSDIKYLVDGSVISEVDLCYKDFIWGFLVNCNLIKKDTNYHILNFSRYWNFSNVVSKKFTNYYEFIIKFIYRKLDLHGWLNYCIKTWFQVPYFSYKIRSLPQLIN